MVGNITTTSIITNGLSGQSACAGMITTFVSLYVYDYVPPQPPPIKYGGGGPYPGPAWNKVDNIQQFYTPVNSPRRAQPQQPMYVVPKHLEGQFFKEKTTIVMVTINLNDKIYDKTFSVPDKYKSITIKAVNVLNTSIKVFKGTVTNIINVTKKLKNLLK